ncbi:hypothetical protein EDB19DRAFT_645230 [Suillus lakei]|nr:hypothetical protein EDB19DRAFT_645230 [Suillus lakei]
MNETLEFGTAAEWEAWRPQINLAARKQRLKAFKARRQELFERGEVVGLQYHEDEITQPGHLDAPPPSLDAMYGMNAGFGGGPLGMQAQMENAGVPASCVPHYPHYNLAPRHYSLYPGPQAIDVAPYSSPLVLAVPAPAVGANLQATVLTRQEQEQAPATPPASAMQWHASQIPEDVNHRAPSLCQEEWQTRGTKRKAVDDDDTKQTRQKRLCPQGHPDAPDAIATVHLIHQPDGPALDVPFANWNMDVDS